jgi:hypothetical protein
VIRERRERLRKFVGCVKAAVLPSDALRRDRFYED